jgi:hypothetical protein
MVNSIVRMEGRNDTSCPSCTSEELPLDIPSTVDFPGPMIGPDSRSGYMADSEDEGVYQWNLPSKLMSKAMAKPRSATVITKKRQYKNRAYRQSTNKRNRRDHENPQSWIQRIYSHTPFSAASIEENTKPDDYSWTTSETIEKIVEARQNLFQTYRKSDEIRSTTTARSTSSSSSTLKGHPMVSLHEDSDTIETTAASEFTSDMEDDSDAVEDEMETALLNTLSGLLHESQEVQAQYRAYSLHDDRQTPNGLPYGREKDL